MSGQVRWIVLSSIAAALVAFLIVQDRITATGARDYVTVQRNPEIGQPPPTIDQVMRPAVRRSVRLGAACGAVVLAAGLAAAVAVTQLERRNGR